MDADGFYTSSLTGLRLPSEEYLAACVNSIEKDFIIFKAASEDADKYGEEILTNIGNRIELLKMSLQQKGRLFPTPKPVFFRETAHRIDEDFVLLKGKEELLADGAMLIDNMKMTSLPADVVKTWESLISETTKKLGEPENDSKPDGLSGPRKTIRAALNMYHRAIDNSYFQEYMSKLHNVAQMAIVFLVLALIAIVHWKNTFTAVKDISGINYFFYCALGALGGSLASIMSATPQSVIKGSSFVNFSFNVLMRPVIGAASAFIMVLIAKSEIVFGFTDIHQTANDVAANTAAGMRLAVNNPESAYKVIGFVAGFAGEKWLRSTIDPLVNRLSADAAKNTSSEQQNPGTPSGN